MGPWVWEAKEARGFLHYWAGGCNTKLRCNTTGINKWISEQGAQSYVTRGVRKLGYLFATPYPSLVKRCIQEHNFLTHMTCAQHKLSILHSPEQNAFRQVLINRFTVYEWVQKGWGWGIKVSAIGSLLYFNLIVYIFILQEKKHSLFILQKYSP